MKKLKCHHCGGDFEIENKPEQERYILRCKKCGCVFGTTIIRNDPKCYNKRHPDKKTITKAEVSKKKKGRRRRRKVSKSISKKNVRET